MLGLKFFNIDAVLFKIPLCAGAHICLKMNKRRSSNFFNLTCELYPESLVSNLVKESKFLNDVTLVADDQSYKKFPANKVLLSSCSDILKDVLLN